MTLRQLTYLLAIVEEGSVTRAAQKLRIAQPSLSQQLRALERELGGPLVERLPRSVRLTSLGREFVPHAREVVFAAERAKRAARAAQAVEAGELEIATVRSIAIGLLPPSIRRWRRAHAGTTVRLHEFAHRTLLEESMRSGIADLAIGPQPVRWDGVVETLGFEEFVVVLASDDELHDAQRVPLAALSDREWVLFERAHGLSDVVAFACANAGFIPRPAVETAQVEAAARLAAAGLGPALVPMDAIPGDLRDNAHSLDPPLGRKLVCFARTDFGALATAYLDCLRTDAWPAAPADALVVP